MIKEMRERRGFSQKQLAEKAGINISQVQKLEAGTIKFENVTVRNGLAIAKALEIPIESLLGE